MPVRIRRPSASEAPAADAAKRPGGGGSGVQQGRRPLGTKTALGPAGRTGLGDARGELSSRRAAGVQQIRGRIIYETETAGGFFGSARRISFAGRRTRAGRSVGAGSLL